ncbi:MAG: hypothetical protein IJO32_04475 [Bacilli bacterium]|nr:hypothetical protein [Bacilli bacterium]
MTIREYLEILNDCEIDDGMNSKLGLSAGVLDFSTTNYKLKDCIHFEVNFYIKNNAIIAQREFYTKRDILFDLKKILLEDSIITCFNNAISEIDIINNTILELKRNIRVTEKLLLYKKLKKYKESIKSDLKKIEKFEYYMENSKQKTNKLIFR